MAPTPAIPAGMSQQMKPEKGFDSLQSWLAKYGAAEYANYKETATVSALSYDDWATSDHILGPYMLQLSLDAWDSDSNDEEVREPAKPAPSVQPEVRSPPAPTTAAKAVNGRSALLDFSSAAFGITNPVERAADMPKEKKKRKSRKKPTSEPVVEVDDDDDTHAASLVEAESVTPSNSTKKPKQTKKSTPATTPAAQPATAAKTTPTPDVAPPNANASGSTSPEATRSGLRTRTAAQQRPYLYHDKIFEEIEEVTAGENAVSKPRRSKLRVSFPVSEPETDTDLEDSAHEEPEIQPEVPASTGKKFKGKGRAWRKENEDEDEDYQGTATKKPKKRGRPPKRNSLTATVVETKESQPEPEPEPVQKEVSAVAEEEVDDSVMVINDAQPQSESKARRKPKRAHKSEEFIHSDSDAHHNDDHNHNEAHNDPAQLAASDLPQQDENADDDVIMLDDVDQPLPTQPEKRKRRKSVKIPISEEFVQSDDSDFTAEQKKKKKTEKLDKGLAARLPATPLGGQTKEKKAGGGRRKPAKSLAAGSDVNANEAANGTPDAGSTPGLTPGATPGAPGTGEKEKKRRRPRKKPISEAFIRDDSDEDGEQGGRAEEREQEAGFGMRDTVTPAPVGQSTNGDHEATSSGKKSSRGKGKKTPQSARQIDADVEMQDVDEDEDQEPVTPSRRGKRKSVGSARTNGSA